MLFLSNSDFYLSSNLKYNSKEDFCWERDKSLGNLWYCHIQGIGDYPLEENVIEKFHGIMKGKNRELCFISEKVVYKVMCSNWIKRY